MTEWIAVHPNGVDILIFLIAAMESLAVVGLIIPGTVVMFGVGALVGKGDLELWPVLIWAMAGAIAGDGLSYWLGRHFRDRVRGIWPFSRYPGLLHRGEEFFHRYGGKSVLLGRFVGPVRPLIPLVAGMMGMSPARFYFANVLSGMAWSPAHILPGVVFGTAYALAAEISMRLAILAVAVVVIVWSLISGIRIATHWLKPFVMRLIASIAKWSQAPNRSPCNPLIALLDPARREGGVLILFAALLIGSSLALTALVEDVVTKDTIVQVDSAVFHLLNGLRTPTADNIMIAVTELGDAQVTFAITLTVLVYLLWSHKWRAAVYWLSSIVFAALLTLAIKAGLHLPRPIPLYQGLSQFGFPSGHATMSVVIYGFLAIFIGRGTSTYSKMAIATGTALLIFLIAFSRLYLGAHWLSDVLGGIAFGTAWIAFLAIGYLRRSKTHFPATGVAVTAILTLVLVATWHVSESHKSDVARYTPRIAMQSMSHRTWYTSGWSMLPAWRVDFGGEYEQPFTFQWAGSLDYLRQRLLDNGWIQPDPFTAVNCLKLFDMNLPASTLPVLPNSHEGQYEELTLIHPVDNDSYRMVLRLWSAHARLEATGKELWLGTVIREQIFRPLDWIAIPKGDGKYDEPRNYLQHDLGNLTTQLKQQMVRLKIKESWDGKVLLAEEPLD